MPLCDHHPSLHTESLEPHAAPDRANAAASPVAGLWMLLGPHKQNFPEMHVLNSSLLHFQVSLVRKLPCLGSLLKMLEWQLPPSWAAQEHDNSTKIGAQARLTRTAVSGTSTHWVGTTQATTGETPEGTLPQPHVNHQKSEGLCSASAPPIAARAGSCSSPLLLPKEPSQRSRRFGCRVKHEEHQLHPSSTRGSTGLSVWFVKTITVFRLQR